MKKKDTRKACEIKANEEMVFFVFKQMVWMGLT